jgi:hypothetical protein
MAAKKNHREKSDVEPFLDRKAPGDGEVIAVVVLGGEVLDVEQVAEKVAEPYRA